MYLWPQGAVPPDFNPLRRGWVYCLAPEAPLLKGMPTGSEAFLEMPGACGLRPCAWPHPKKRPCAILVRLVGRKTNTISYSHQPGVIRTNCFSAVPCSFDFQTTVSCYNLKLDKDLIHAGLRTGLYGRDLIHESQYILLHFSSQQRNKFLYFCSTIVNIVFSFINISTLQM